MIKQKHQNSPKLIISYHTDHRDYSLKQHNTVKYFGCYLDSNLKGGSMGRRVFKKINIKLNLLWKQSN